MTEGYFEIAGLRLRAECPEGFPEEPGILEGYLTGPGDWDHNCRMTLADSLPEPEGEQVFQCPEFTVYRKGKTSIRRIGDYIHIRREGRESTVVFRRSALPYGITAKLLLSAMELEQLLAEHGGFLLHAAFIRYGDGAILFTAPSETGKSTQARLWCDHMDAELINGDRAAVRILEGRLHACGIPFSGSSPVRKNRILPLRAIVYLSQAKENSVTRLRGVRAFSRVWEGCGIPMWDREAVRTVTDTLSAVLAKVPVYHLACTPDERAVKCLFEALEAEV